jgi:hypothetical protein
MHGGCFVPPGGIPKRVDYEYARQGKAAIFLFVGPLVGWRQATVRHGRRKVDWAEEVASLLDGRYARRPKITRMCGNLHTNTKGAFYAAFPPDKAYDYVHRIKFCYMPKHGSWLNIAACEFSCLERQSVHGSRIGELNTLEREVKARAADTNKAQRGVGWHMTIKYVRCKLERLCLESVTCRSNRPISF